MGRGFLRPRGLLIAIALATGAVGTLLLRTPQAEPATAAICNGQLRSWIVAGRARHLYLELNCPPPHERLSGRVEFTSAALRRDYDAASDRSGPARLARMTPGRPLAPPSFSPPPDGRLEATYRLTPDQAAALQRDRVFDAPYVLLCTNSNAALRRVMESSGLTMPPRVLAGAGVTGEFPGIDCDPGNEVSLEQWTHYGIVSRPADDAESPPAAGVK